MTNVKTKLPKNKKIIIIVSLAIVLLVVLGLSVYVYKKIEQRKALQEYPENYPYTCNSVEQGSRDKLSCAVIEDKGKVIVANRPEVKQLVRTYGRKGVIIKALEFADIKDKDFLKRLLGDHYSELGCIIYVSYPGGQQVYLENEKLAVFEQLDSRVFTQWLHSASEQDIERFNNNLH